MLLLQWSNIYCEVKKLQCLLSHNPICVSDYSTTDEDNEDDEGAASASGINDTLGSNAGGIGNQSYTLGLSDTSSNNSIPVSEAEKHELDE